MKGGGTTPFGINLMRSQALCRDAQVVADVLIAYEFGTCYIHSCAVYALWVTAARVYAGQYVDMPGFVCDDISGFTTSLTFV